MGNTFLQAVIADQKMQREDRKIGQDDEQLKIDRMRADGQMFKRIAGDVLGPDWSEAFTHIHQVSQPMKASSQAGRQLPNPQLNQVARVMPPDLTNAGPGALALANQWQR
jgi:hypothetical protein